jgi:hypothetical protein
MTTCLCFWSALGQHLSEGLSFYLLIISHSGFGSVKYFGLGWGASGFWFPCSGDGSWNPVRGYNAGLLDLFLSRGRIDDRSVLWPLAILLLPQTICLFSNQGGRRLYIMLIGHGLLVDLDGPRGSGRSLIKWTVSLFFSREMGGLNVALILGWSGVWVCFVSALRFDMVVGSLLQEGSLDPVELSGCVIVTFVLSLSGARAS